MNDKCLIIAEAGVNHNGNLSLAYRLCDAAKDAGADVIKFQTWITDEIITKSVEQAEYQKNNIGKMESQYDMLKRLELSFDEFRTIKVYCDRIGITFASTADEGKSLDFLTEIGIPFIKVSSGDIGNVPFLRYMGKKRLPVILSTGMSTLGDVELSLAALREGGAEDITILHCTTNYPCPYEQVNLKAMQTLQSAFHLPVGYSDHTVGAEAAIAAVAMGAKVIEKHFTLDKTMEGPDHLASTEPREFKELVNMIRHAEKLLGDGKKEPTADEKSIKKVVTKRIVARKNVEIGEQFTEQNLCTKRSDKGSLARDWDKIVGQKAVREYAENDGIVI